MVIPLIRAWIKLPGQQFADLVQTLAVNVGEKDPGPGGQEFTANAAGNGPAATGHQGAASGQGQGASFLQFGLFQTPVLHVKDMFFGQLLVRGNGGTERLGQQGVFRNIGGDGGRFLSDSGGDNAQARNQDDPGFRIKKGSCHLSGCDLGMKIMDIALFIGSHGFRNGLGRLIFITGLAGQARADNFWCGSHDPG